jgi:hypothetical protein
MNPNEYINRPFSLDWKYLVPVTEFVCKKYVSNSSGTDTSSPSADSLNQRDKSSAGKSDSI